MAEISIFQGLSKDDTPSKPEESPEAYTPEKISQRLEFVTNFKSRNVTPTTKILLDAYEEKLERIRVETQAAAISRLQKDFLCYDKFIHCNSFLKSTLEENLLELRKVQYMARYGDYFAREVKELKKAVQRLTEVENKEAFNDYWTSIQAQIENEKEVRANSKSPMTSEIPTLLAIDAACRANGLVQDHVYWAIEKYATRNSMFHSDLNELLQKGHFGLLANLVYADGADIRRVVHPDSKEDIRQLEFTIAKFKQVYFDIRVGWEDDPYSWTATDAAKRTTFQLHRTGKNTETDYNIKKDIEAKTEKDDELNRHAKIIVDSLKCDLTGPLSAEEIVARKRKQKLAQELLGIQEAIDKCQDDSGSKISKMRRTREKLQKRFRKVLGMQSTDN